MGEVSCGVFINVWLYWRPVLLRGWVPLRPSQGVPVRVEIGPRDIKEAKFVAVCRDTGDKSTFPSQGAAKELKGLLDEIQRRLLEK